MVRVTVWLQLMLLVLILRQSAAASAQCSELQSKIDRLEKAVNTTTAQKPKCEIQNSNCNEFLTEKTDLWQQAFQLSNKLMKKLEAKEEVLKANNEIQTQRQTAIDGLKKAVDSLNQKALFEIGQWNSVKIVVDSLYEAVENLNQRSLLLCKTHKDVCPSLLEAAKSGDVNTTKVLFKCSSDNCTDDDRQNSTPLMNAGAEGHVEVVRVLLEEGANLERVDAYGRRAMHHAVWKGRQDVCRLLLDWGAKLNAQNKNGDTPLHNAAHSGYQSVVKLLVERGADVSLKNDSGQTASDVARSQGKKDVAEWLERVNPKEEALTV